MNAVETDASSDEELLTVELSTEDVNVSTAEVVNVSAVSHFPSKIYAAMEIQGKTVKMQIDIWCIMQCTSKEIPSNRNRGPEDKQVVDSLQQRANPSTWNSKSEHA